MTNNVAFANQAGIFTFTANRTTTTPSTHHGHHPTSNLSLHQNHTFISFLNPQVISISGPFPATQAQTQIHNSDYIDFNDHFLFNQILHRIAAQANAAQETFQTLHMTIRTANSFINSLSKKPIFKNLEPLLAPCPVCTEEFRFSSLISELPCKHLFHNECIVPWLYQNCACPMCRFELPKETVSGPLMRYTVRVGNESVEGWGVERESGFWDAISRNEVNLGAYPGWFLGRFEMGSIGPEVVWSLCRTIPSGG